MKRLILLGCLATLWITPIPAQVLDRPVAVVRLTETVNIGQRELKEEVRQLEQQVGQDLTDSDRREVLNARINEVLINQAAERQDVTVTEQQVQQAIARQKANLGTQVSDQQFRQIVRQQAGLSWDEYVSQIRQRLIQEQYVLETHREMFDDVKQPTDSEIRSFYEKNATQFSNPAMVRFTHVFFDTRNASQEQIQEKRSRAQELYRQIESGETTFDEVVLAAEDDPNFSAGDFGYLMRQDRTREQFLGSEFVDKVFRIEEGSLSRGVLQSRVGFHIVKVTNKRDPRLLQLDDPILPGENTTVRDRIRNYLLVNQQQQVFQRALEQAVADLRQEADITVYEENLNW